jgi:hypothetical protein
MNTLKIKENLEEETEGEKRRGFVPLGSLHESLFDPRICFYETPIPFPTLK